MPTLDPAREQLRVLIFEIAGAEVHDSLDARNTLELGPHLGQFRGHVKHGNTRTTRYIRSRMG